MFSCFRKANPAIVLYCNYWTGINQSEAGTTLSDSSERLGVLNNEIKFENREQERMSSQVGVASRVHDSHRRAATQALKRHELFSQHAGPLSGEYREYSRDMRL
jgi:hypothetical protein